MSEQNATTEAVSDDRTADGKVISTDRISRRAALGLAGGVVLGGLLQACGSSESSSDGVSADGESSTTSNLTVVTDSFADVELAILGPGYSTINEMLEQASKDLGFKISGRVAGTDEYIQQAVTQPDAFDVLHGEFFTMPLIWPSGNLQAIDAGRIERYNDFVGIFTDGKLLADSQVAQGAAPHSVMYLTGADTGEFAPEATNWITTLPTVYNADALGYRPDLTGRDITSWAELFNDEWSGSTSILDIPSTGIIDAALAAEASGLMTFGDKGNMTRAEIDEIIGILIGLKRAGHFRAFWGTFQESIDLMAAGETLVQSMWSPAVTAVRAQGIPCLYGTMDEGYRAWGSGINFNSKLEGKQLDAAYAYANWWNEGWAGGFIAKQGYYSAVPSTARENLTDSEWGFWYGGAEAAEPVLDPFGTEIEAAGAVRDGGSFEDRMGNLAVWNSAMDEQDYLVQKWTEFVAS